MIYLELFGVVLVAAIVSFLIGWLWYSEKTFGTVWMKGLGITKGVMSSEQKKKMMQGMIVSLISDMAKAFFLLFLAVMLRYNQFLLAFIIWLGFIIPLLLTTTIYEKRSWNVFMVTAGYQLVSLMAMALVFQIAFLLF